LLAGQKLLLADDSITIQKVVELTFADEGVDVVCVNNGRDAIDRIEQSAPDVILADVFMPQMNGYEVCEYVKQNDRLKHIPVMLLFGSFEPFDEAEARRVGADDTLTKPFQSIRRLIDKVGLLVSGRQPDAEAPTAELPKPDIASEPEELSEQEIEITTADTQPLPPELGHITQEWERPNVTEEAVPTEKEGVIPISDPKVDEFKMESHATENPENVAQAFAGAGDVLLDLGDYDASSAAPSDEFSLDLDLDEVPEASPIESAFPAAAFSRRAEYKARARKWTTSSQVTLADETQEATIDQLVTTLDFQQPAVEAAAESKPEPFGVDRVEEQAQVQPVGTGASDVSLDSLSPEVIDAIARRAVEQLSEKVIQEIAWEVVPQLAELMIKRQLEEKNN
jgi:CheY-like chemotaxis protein